MAPEPQTMCRLAAGQTWRDIKTNKSFTIGKEGCGENKDQCLCLWAPSFGLAHTACPCCYDEVKGERCYFACIINGGLGIVVWGGGKKMHTQFCGYHTHFELVEPTMVSAPAADGV